MKEIFLFSRGIVIDEGAHKMFLTSHNNTNQNQQPKTMTILVFKGNSNIMA
jgi:hypothetical protein